MQFYFGNFSSIVQYMEIANKDSLDTLEELKMMKELVTKWLSLIYSLLYSLHELRYVGRGSELR